MKGTKGMGNKKMLTDTGFKNDETA